MAYTVIKWVKGHPYLYEQRSFREGKTVRTASAFIGRAHAADIAASVAKRQPPAAVPLVSDDEQPQAAGLTITVDLDRAGVSESELRYHYTQVVGQLHRIGIDPAAVPPIFVRHGLRVDSKPRWRGGYVVTVPPGTRVDSAAVRAAFHRALARACVGAVRLHQPERYAALSLHMEQSFRATNAAVIRYVTNTRHRAAWAWVIALRLFGIANAVRVRGAPISAGTLGLVEYGRRSSWEDEAAAVLGDVLAHGFDASWRAYLIAREKAEAIEGKTARAYRAAGLLKRRAARRAWQRANARVATQAERGEKLVTLRAVFGFT